MKIGFIKISQMGGPSNFMSKIINILSQKNTINFYPSLKKNDVIFIFGGSKKVWWIFYQKILGAKIVHRVDDINWRYKFEKNLLKKISSQLKNFSVYFYLNFSNGIIYQSEYSKSLYKDKLKFFKKKSSSIIYNGTPLLSYREKHINNDSKFNILIAEGSIHNDPVTFQIIKNIIKIKIKSKKVNFHIIGNIDNYLKDKLHEIDSRVKVYGYIKKSEAYNLMRKCECLFSIELGAACPNIVIEAMSLKLPIIGYKIGSLVELLGNDYDLLDDFPKNKVHEYEVGDLANHDFNYIIEKFYHNKKYYCNYVYQRYLDNFQINKIGNDYNRYIKSLLG